MALALTPVGAFADGRVDPAAGIVIAPKLAPGAAPMPPLVDAYVVLRLPDGGFFSLTASGGAVPGIQAIATGVTPAPVSGTLLHYVFTGAEPSGAYAFFAAPTQTGTTAVIGSVDEGDFTVSP